MKRYRMISTMPDESQCDWTISSYRDKDGDVDRLLVAMRDAAIEAGFPTSLTSVTTVEELL